MIALVFGGALLSCEAPLPELPAPAPDAGVRVRIQPPAPLGAVPSVIRLQVEGADSDRFRLFEGELSAYHLSRLDQELPSTLRERLVPLVAWKTGGKTTLAVGRALQRDALYSLTEPTAGTIATIRVSAEAEPPDLKRVWPPAGRVTAGRVILCGSAPLSYDGDVRLQPGDLTAGVQPMAIETSGSTQHCGEIVLTEPAVDGSTLVLPLEIAGRSVEPIPLRLGSSAPASAVSCADSEVQLGPGCALVDDDRIAVRALGAATFWSVGPHPSFSGAVEAGGRFAVRGFEPDSLANLAVTVWDLAGHKNTWDVVVQTAPPMSHLVINEVLANPVGPEPAQEWVELFNDGATRVDVGGWMLEDSGGTTKLPAVVVPPGKFALVVGQDLDRGASFDVPIDERATIVVVPRVGTHGLANAGEPLILRDPAGNIRSRFPASPRPAPGVSVARAHPEVPDDDPSGFGLHGDAGASPGWDNVLQSSEPGSE